MMTGGVPDTPHPGPNIVMDSGEKRDAFSLTRCHTEERDGSIGFCG